MDTKIILTEKEMPKAWYNLLPDLPFEMPPMLHPVTKEQLPSASPLHPLLFPAGLNTQEYSTERWIDIPDEVQQIYKLWRPTPMYRAHRLEKALDTPCKIYYKYEGVSPAGSHKPNTAIPQAYYNKKEGVKRIATETGAGQWGSALALACTFFGLECKVYMVKASYYQKPYRKTMMEAWGAKVVPSPSPDTEVGRKILAENPDSAGSLGIAISEALEDALSRDDTRYSLGSVLNHVLMHQTVIGLESKVQLEKVGAYPDVLVGCVGGGSNFAGMFMPFIKDKLNGKKTRIICCEPQACPSMTKGVYTYDFGDTAGIAPIVKMDTLGHTFMPPSIHAGGLRYHGMAPMVSMLHNKGLLEAVAYPQRSVFEAALTFARTEGIIPAPEPAHAIRALIDLALEYRERGEAKTLLLSLSGHGNFDMGAYDNFLSGKLEDYEYPREKIQEALKLVPQT